MAKYLSAQVKRCRIWPTGSMDAVSREYGQVGLVNAYTHTQLVHSAYINR